MIESKLGADKTQVEENLSWIWLKINNSSEGVKKNVILHNSTLTQSSFWKKCLQGFQDLAH